MNHLKIWFCRILKLGIAVNAISVLPVLIAPAWTFSLLSVPPPEPLVYARIAAFLILVISMLYLPAGLDPDRYRLVAWLAVLARMMGTIFFVAAAIGLGAPMFYVPALMDCVFFVPQGILLVLGTRIAGRLQAA